MPITVHHLTPTFRPHDALGVHTKNLHGLVTNVGNRSLIWSGERRSPAPAKHWRRFKTERSGRDLLIYQAATGSEMVEEILLRQETLIVNYHNITPAHYFDQLAPNLAFELRQGREQLSRMAKRARMAIADSEFNASELRALGFANVLTIPVLADFGKRVERKPRTEPVLRGSQWLFVGRLVPNKAQHDLIVALAAYRELYDSEATLTLVGGGLPSYQKKLQDLLSELGISEAVRMVGVVSEEEKRDYFRSADIYLSLSDHEGYGVPLVEAMHHGLPVVAFDVAAVGETVGKSGLLLLEKKPTNVAAVIFEVLSDPKVYQSIVASGLDRSKELSYHYSAKAFIEALSPLLYD